LFSSAAGSKLIKLQLSPSVQLDYGKNNGDDDRLKANDNDDYIILSIEYRKVPITLNHNQISVPEVEVNTVHVYSTLDNIVTIPKEIIRDKDIRGSQLNNVTSKYHDIPSRVQEYSSMYSHRKIFNTDMESNQEVYATVDTKHISIEIEKISNMIIPVIEDAYILVCSGTSCLSNNVIFPSSYNYFKFYY
jgi:hypothetical protein